MTRKPVSLVALRVAAVVLCGAGAWTGAARPASASPPDPSVGCSLQPRLSAGDYTEAKWPIRQTGTNNQIVWRMFNVHVPKQHEAPGGAPLPVVLNLHGLGETGESQDRVSRMRDLGDAKGFIVVTPNSWPWRGWSAFDGDTEPRRGFSDVEFIQTLLYSLVQDLCVDRNRIYSTGGSLGGLMSATLARVSAEGKLGEHKIAAIALVATLPVPPYWALPVPRVADLADPEQSFAVFLPPSVEALEDLADPAVTKAVPREPVPMHVFYSSHDRLLANGACYGTYSAQVSAAEEKKRTAVRTFLCECYGASDAKLCPPSRPGIRGKVESIANIKSNVSVTLPTTPLPTPLPTVAWGLTALWAKENGCNIDVLDLLKAPVPTGESGWGVPAATVTFRCNGVANGRADTILTVFDTLERAHPTHPNSVEVPGGHIWPGGDGDDSTFKVTDAVWDFFEKHPR